MYSFKDFPHYAFKVSVEYSTGATKTVTVVAANFSEACRKINVKAKLKGLIVKSIAADMADAKYFLPKKERKQARKQARRQERKRRFHLVAMGSDADTVSRLISFLGRSHSDKYKTIRDYYLRWDRKEYRRCILGIKANNPKRNTFFSRTGLNYNVNLWWDDKPFKPYED